jgi:hypothetical protein
MAEMFSDLPHRVVTLEHPTRGPAETISMGASKAHVSGAVTICDCDHSVEVGPLFDLVLSEDPFDCAVPVWPLSMDEVHAWAVARLDEGGRITAIAEKKVPPGHGEIAGVIGCYAFRDVADALSEANTTKAANFSEIMARWIAAGRVVRGLRISHADFFGDPARLNAALKKRHGNDAAS